MPDQLISEDWKKEYEKILLSKKYMASSSVLGIAFVHPTIENVKLAYGHVQDYVTSLPIGMGDRFKDSKDRRIKFLEKLDDIGLVLFGNKEISEVQKLMKEFKVSSQQVRKNVRIEDELKDLPNLVKELRKVLVESGEFAFSLGLRITISQPKKSGMTALMEQEGFDDLEIKNGKEEQEE